MSVTNYCLESGLYLAIGAVLYHVFFKIDVNYSLNRLGLLLLFLSAVAIPFLPKFSSTLGMPDLISIILPSVEIGQIAPGATGSYWLSFFWIEFAIWIVVLLMVTRTGLGIAKVTLIKRNGHPLRLNNLNIVLHQKPIGPFSFFRTIYLNEADFQNTELREMVLTHEKAHVDQLHSLDNIIIEAIGWLQWWNPFYHLLKKHLYQVHEYAADQAVVDEFDIKQYIELLIRSNSKIYGMPVVNAFFSQPLKSRVIMMKKLKNNNRIIWKQLLLLPIIGGLFLLHSCADDATNETTEKIVNADDVVKEEAEPIAQALPRFPGCEELAVDARDKCAQQKLLQYIAENIKYPEDAKSKSIEGTVISKFFVTTEGAIEDIKIVKPLGYGCDEEVVRVLENMNGVHTWIPGTQEGKKVKVMFTLPVRFKLK